LFGFVFSFFFFSNLFPPLVSFPDPQSAPLVLPCVNVNPMARPTALQISQHLDWLTNRICVMYQANLSKQETEQLRSGARR
jgi:hypothetical protein